MSNPKFCWEPKCPRWNGKHHCWGNQYLLERQHSPLWEIGWYLIWRGCSNDRGTQWRISSPEANQPLYWYTYTAWPTGLPLLSHKQPVRFRNWGVINWISTTSTSITSTVLSDTTSCLRSNKWLVKQLWHWSNHTQCAGCLLMAMTLPVGCLQRWYNCGHTSWTC